VQPAGDMKTYRKIFCLNSYGKLRSGDLDMASSAGHAAENSSVIVSCSHRRVSSLPLKNCPLPLPNKEGMRSSARAIFSGRRTSPQSGKVQREMRCARCCSFLTASDWSLEVKSNPRCIQPWAMVDYGCNPRSLIAFSTKCWDQRCTLDQVALWVLVCSINGPNNQYLL